MPLWAPLSLLPGDFLTVMIGQVNRSPLVGSLISFTELLDAQFISFPRTEKPFLGIQIWKNAYIVGGELFVSLFLSFLLSSHRTFMKKRMGVGSEVGFFFQMALGTRFSSKKKPASDFQWPLSLYWHKEAFWDIHIQNPFHKRFLGQGQRKNWRLFPF